MSDNLNDLKEEYKRVCARQYEISTKLGWGDTSNYSRQKEALMAVTLKHRLASEYAGADAYKGETDDFPVEYKSTVDKHIKATYNGISRHSTWEEQEAYLKNDKIGKYKEHYIARFVGPEIVEMYMLTSDKVLEYILPKIKIQYENRNSRKDPRLGIQLSKKFIISNGTKLI